MGPDGFGVTKEKLDGRGKKGGKGRGGGLMEKRSWKKGMKDERVNLGVEAGERE